MCDILHPTPHTHTKHWKLFLNFCFLFCFSFEYFIFWFFFFFIIISCFFFFECVDFTKVVYFFFIIVTPWIFQGSPWILNFYFFVFFFQLYFCFCYFFLCYLFFNWKKKVLFLILKFHYCFLSKKKRKRNTFVFR